MTKPTVVFFDLDETLVENRLPIQDVFERMYFDFEESLGQQSKEVFFDALREQASLLWNGMFYIDTPPEEQFIGCFEHAISATHRVESSHKIRLARDSFTTFSTSVPVM